MRLVLKLVALLVHGFLLTSSGVYAGCPLDFSKYRHKQLQACASPQGNEIESSECCITALVTYTKALALHTNTTPGLPLFLNETDQSACVDAMAQENYVDGNACSLGPPSFTAYASPCLFGSRGELHRALTSGSRSGLEDLVKKCANLDKEQEQEGGSVDCIQAFNEYQTALTEKHNDTDINCGVALLVSVASHNISQEGWLNRLYGSLELPFVTEPVISVKRSDLPDALLGTILGIILFVGLPVMVVKLRKKYSRQSTKDAVKGGENDLASEYADKLARHAEHVGPVLSQGSLYSFSSKELLKATDNFSSKNFIGEGSAGKVFKGALPSGQLVAIKLIMNEKKLNTFYKEVENLSKVRHTNLVTLLGYCQTPNEHLLVYEYCSRGNLWHYLFGKGPILTWEQRINIALGSARGIWYLHLYPGGYIVHRDLKPTNILLNEHMEAKVSDFGLSRFIAIEESRVFTEVKGTTGYLDPEYLSLGTLTFASDVYSFGIVLLELISGRRPFDLNLTKRLPLVKMANLVIKGGEALSELVDPRLEGCYSETAFMKMTQIAVQCTSDRAAQRPSMIDVLQGLEEAWRLARLESPPQPSLRRTPRATSGSWSPVSEDGQTGDGQYFDYSVWESRTFDAHSPSEEDTGRGR
ncbi:hypothetical protein Mapa_013710 [Marchantia paleacea]|nr:hypothetical protein Mapa_013710 [Marchantia paleacea]